MLLSYQAVLVLCRDLAKKVKNPLIVRAAEQAHKKLQETKGEQEFLESVSSVSLVLQSTPWNIYQKISEQSRLWSEKKALERSHKKNQTCKQEQKNDHDKKEFLST